MPKLKRNTNIIFYKICAIGLFFLTLFLFSGTLLYNRLSLLLNFLGNKIESICGCANHFSFFNHPIIFSFLFLSGLGIISFSCFAIIKTLKLKKTTNYFIKTALNNKKGMSSNKLQRVVDSLNIKNEVIEINDRRPLVFCFGLIKPKICISSAFIEKLSKKELRAVLLHEQYHLVTHETLRLFIIKAIVAILFFVPGLKALSKQYFILSELSADEWSINNCSDKIPLAGAMYKILALKEKIHSGNNLAIASFGHIAEERIEKIINDNYRLSIKILKPKLLFNFFVLFCFAVAFISITYFSNSAMASHNSNICSTNHQNMNEQCQMSLRANTSTCEMEQKNVSLEVMICNETS